MSVYYFYRMRSDTGNAPCVFENYYKPSNLLTLACCKGGQIRHYKNRMVPTPVRTGVRSLVRRDMEKDYNNDYYVIGIMEDRVVWAAKIKQAIPMKEYFKDKKYRNRMDCIYDVDEKDPDKDEWGNKWELKRRKKFNPNFHGTDDINRHHLDELGEYVLISEEFIYQGKDTTLTIKEKIKEKMPKHQETKKYNGNDEDIKEFVEECMNHGQKNNEPTEKLDSIKGSNSCVCGKE